MPFLGPPTHRCLPRHCEVSEDPTGRELRELPGSGEPGLPNIVDCKSTALGPRPLAAPGGAALAGVTFSILMIISLGLVRVAVPVDLKTPDIWMAEPDRRSAIQLALKLVPFAGIAFLWFIGVLRNRMGELEDRFFASVFLGSGFLFVASMFGTAAVLDALIDSMAIGKLVAVSTCSATILATSCLTYSQ
jgi:hypothetical protein